RATSSSATEDSAWWAHERGAAKNFGWRDLRPGAGLVAPRLGPGDDDAGGRRAGPRRAAGDDRPRRARAARLGRARKAARGAPGRGGIAPVRVGRGEPDPRRAPRPREGKPGTGG